VHAGEFGVILLMPRGNPLRLGVIRAPAANRQSDKVRFARDPSTITKVVTRRTTSSGGRLRAVLLMRRPETYATSIVTWWYFAAELVEKIEDEADLVDLRCPAGGGVLQHGEALVIRVRVKVVKASISAAELAGRP
jgi:hypothetical protein